MKRSYLLFIFLTIATNALLIVFIGRRAKELHRNSSSVWAEIDFDKEQGGRLGHHNGAMDGVPKGQRGPTR